MAVSGQRGGETKVKTFVLVNIPDVEDKTEYLLEYVESTLDTNVETIDFHPGVPDKALVTLKDYVDLCDASEKVSDTPMENQILEVQSVKHSNVVIVSADQLQEKLTHLFVKLYFQSEYADGREIVTKYIQMPASAALAVAFTDDAVTRTIINSPNHLPLPSENYKLEVSPFYGNFHGLIPFKGTLLGEALKDVEESHTAGDADSPWQTSHDDDNEMEIEQGPTREEESSVDNLTVSVRKIQLQDNGRTLNSDSDEMKNDGRNVSLQDNGRTLNSDSDEMKNDGRNVSSLGGLCQSKSMSSEGKCKEMSANADVPRQILSHSESGGMSQLSHSNRPRNQFQRSSSSNSTFDEEKGEEKVKVNINAIEWSLLKDKINPNCVLDCVFYYDEKLEALFVKGKNCKDFLNFFQELKSQLCQHHQDIDEGFQSLLNSPKMAKCLSDRFINGHWIAEDRLLRACACDGNALSRFKQDLNEIIIGYAEEVVQMKLHEEFLRKRKSLWEEHFFVAITWDSTSITIVGNKEDVNTVKNEILVKGQEGLEVEKKMKTTEFVLPELHHRLLVAHFQEEIAEALGRQNNLTLTKSEFQSNAVFTFDGPDSDVEGAKRILKDFQEKVKIEEINVKRDFSPDQSLRLIAKLSSEDSRLAETQKRFEKIYQCIIMNEFKKSERCMPVADPQKSVGGNGSPPKEQMCFQVNSSVTLEIKNHGNITEETSDMLVCILPSDKVLHATSVGKAFLDLDGGLQREVKGLAYKDNVAVSLRSLRGKSHKYIAFVVMRKEQGATEFCSIVKEVLNKANEKSLTSISFPALGDAKFLKYPKEFIAENFFLALETNHYPQYTRLKRITFLANNQDLYRTMTADGSKYFQPLSGGSHEKNSGSCAVMNNVLIRIAHRKKYKLIDLWKDRLKHQLDDIYRSTPV